MQNLKKPLSVFTSSPSPDAPSTTAIGSLLKPMPSAEDEVLNQNQVQSQIPAARPSQPDSTHRPFKLRGGRFRRTVWFFLSMFARLLIWELLIKKITGERFVARGRSKRWRHYSRTFRNLAIEMSGVMIKLGQFISSRVDVLPPEITDELAGLQDQVPIVDFAYIKQTIERELGPLDKHFLWVNPEPVAAASFGQVHRAQLKNGDRVVIKIQRPKINDVVQTDLAALGVVARLSMRYGPIRRRANVPDLLDEFSRVLWEELDYIKEADHAVTFASLFAGDPGVYVPSVYLEQTTHFVLTLEDVTSIKLNDYQALEREGIDRGEVASRLLNCYLRQIFDYSFFHADPHPGNLFVYPLPRESTNGRKPPKRPFYLIFIDFGMVGRLTPRLKQGLRETLIAVITQDAKGLVASYQKLGVLMPSANIPRVEEATRAVFDKVWGLNMNELINMPFDEMADVAKEFSDLLLAMPFQMPQDFIYLSRAVGILSGMCTGLDPTFDPWRQMQPFTEKLLSESGINGQIKASFGAGARAAAQVAVKAVRDLVVRAYKLPALVDTLLTRAERGELTVQVAPDDSLQRQVNRIENSISQVSIGVVFATMTLASTLLYITHETGLGTFGFILSGILLLMILMRGRN